MSEILIEDGLIEEAEKLIAEPEELDAWKAKVEELGLEGQIGLLSGKNKSPIPFRVMDAEEKRIYEAVLGAECTVEAYDKEAIPMRVLSLIALAKQENYFPLGIYIRYSETDPDPIAIGKRRPVGREYGEECHLIARWGPELKSLNELRKEAIEKIKTKLQAEAKSAISALQAVMKDPEAAAEKKLNGDYFVINVST